jgi:hypothetical protein
MDQEPVGMFWKPQVTVVASVSYSVREYPAWTCGELGMYPAPG